MISHVIYGIYCSTYTYESHMSKTIISSTILTAPESMSRDSRMTKSDIITVTHSSGGVFSPDEEVEEEVHVKDGGRIESGSQKSSLLPVGAFLGLERWRELSHLECYGERLWEIFATDRAE